MCFETAHPKPLGKPAFVKIWRFRFLDGWQFQSIDDLQPADIEIVVVDFRSVETVADRASANDRFREAKRFGSREYRRKLLQEGGIFDHHRLNVASQMQIEESGKKRLYCN